MPTRSSSPTRTAAARCATRWPTPTPRSTPARRPWPQVAAAGGTEVVVNALVGYAGLAPRSRRSAPRKSWPWPTRESLVVGGEYVMRVAAEHRAPILPIDSEHSAIFQCLAGERSAPRRLIVTCSGRLAARRTARGARRRHAGTGAAPSPVVDGRQDHHRLLDAREQGFRGHRGPLKTSTCPPNGSTWCLRTRSRSCTSMVEFEDGAVKAQLGSADMRIPISHALFYPPHGPNARRAVRHSGASPAHLRRAVDRAKYPALDIAYDCLRRAGGTAACTMNGANEVAVAAFLGGRCRWTDIVRARSKRRCNAQRSHRTRTRRLRRSRRRGPGCWPANS